MLYNCSNTNFFNYSSIYIACKNQRKVSGCCKECFRRKPVNRWDELWYKWWYWSGAGSIQEAIEEWASKRKQIGVKKLYSNWNYRNGGKIRVKNNMMGKAARETSLEILGLKGHYYKMMFDPNDLIMIMLCAVFKVVSMILIYFIFRIRQNLSKILSLPIQVSKMKG
jgi:hypothetical protein